jgi:hypothetical protein
MVWSKPMLTKLDKFRFRFSIKFSSINKPKVQIECHEHENYHDHGFSMLCKKMELKKIIIQSHNTITQ